MPGPDESEQRNAELRQAFLKHLPKRLESARRRTARLATRGWDVNALKLAHREVQFLAGHAGRHGFIELGEALHALESALAPHTDGASLPGKIESERVLALLEVVDSHAVAQAASPPAAERIDVEPAEVIDGDTAADGFQYHTTPPADWLAHHAKPATWVAIETPAEPLVVHEPAAALLAEIQAHRVAPAPVRPTPIAAPGHLRDRTENRRVYHLSDGNPLAVELDQRLESEGFALEILDNAVELNEVLRALTPSLVVVDAPFSADLEEIGLAVRAVRTRSTHRVALLALSESNDVATRLRAMRAGADSFIALPAKATEVLARVHELIDADVAEPYRVMIIEDDRSQALFAESILKKSGMETCAVTDPLSALEALDQFRPELILMDLYMPNCDGMELTALIRERERFISTPIVFLSGEHDTDKRFDALSAGGDDYLEKPIRPKYLISAVTNRVRRARALSRRVQTQNPRDPITGLYDRAHVLDRITEAVASEEGTNLGGVLFIIIDGAHAIRERIGLAAFDALLGQAGGLLSSSISSTDLAARYGDTTFVLLAPGRGSQALVTFGEEIRARFGRHVFEVDDKTMTLAVSVGVAPFALGFPDAADALNGAERACALARSDRDRKVQVYERPAAVGVRDSREALLDEVRDAIKYDRFQLLFQPVVSLQGEAEEKFQVLLRLRAQDGTLHAAAELIPLVERAGLIADVDRWVLARCIAVLHERDRIDRPVHLFVNQSVQGTLDPERPVWIRRQLEARQVGGERLVLEFRFADIREVVLKASTFCQTVRQFGVRVALAGFELNDASLQALDHLPVDYLKLSPRYLAAQHRAELIQLVSIAKERNLLVLAPQIEDAQTAATFWTIGVDYVQGNFVQQAMNDLDFDFRAST